LNEKFDTEYYPDARLARAYFEIGHFDDSIATWESLIEREPNNINYRFSLAATLMEAGRREEAIQVLEEAKTIVPDQKDQIDFYINEIRAGRNP